MDNNWGLVEAGIVERLQALVEDGDAKLVEAASFEEAADVSIKLYPAIIVLFGGAITRERSAVSAGSIAPWSTVTYELHHYITSGTPDRDSRVPLYKLCMKSRNRLLGNEPAGQIYNKAPLFWMGDSRPEQLKIRGTSALKMVSTYEIDQLVYAQVT